MSTNLKHEVERNFNFNPKTISKRSLESGSFLTLLTDGDDFGRTTNINKIPISPMTIRPCEEEKHMISEKFSFDFGGRGATAIGFRKRATQISTALPACKEVKNAIPDHACNDFGGREVNISGFHKRATQVSLTFRVDEIDFPISTNSIDKKYPFLPRISTGSVLEADKIDGKKQLRGSGAMSSQEDTKKIFSSTKSKLTASLLFTRPEDLLHCPPVTTTTSDVEKDLPEQSPQWAWKGFKVDGTSERPTFRCSNRPLFGQQNDWNDLTSPDPPMRRSELQKSVSLTQLPTASCRSLSNRFNEFG